MKINKKSIRENILLFQKRLDDLERIISSNKYYNIVEKNEYPEEIKSLFDIRRSLYSLPESPERTGLLKRTTKMLFEYLNKGGIIKSEDLKSLFREEAEKLEYYRIELERRKPFYIKREELEEIREIGKKLHVPTYQLKQLMRPIPNTIGKIPKFGGKVAYFYFFTEEAYRTEGSKYAILFERLLWIGYTRRDLDVYIIEREDVPNEFWDMITEKLGIRNYPALIVSHESLGIEELDIAATEYNPPSVSFVKWERGWIGDKFLEDRDKLHEFLIDLYDAARKKLTKNTLRKKIILEVLKSVGKSLKDLKDVIITIK
jgi:hypothetical protein